MQHGPFRFHGLPREIDVEFLRSDPDRTGDLDRFLSDEELDRRARFRSTRRQHTFTLGRAAARLLLARCLHVEPSEVGLRVAADGAVEVQGCDLHLSISHTDSMAAVAVSPRPVGIDIEPVKERAEDLASHVLHPDERSLLVGSADPNLVTLRAWVVKESVLKATRLGLRRSPTEVRLTYEDDGMGAAVLSDGTSWRFLHQEADGFITAIAFPP